MWSLPTILGAHWVCDWRIGTWNISCEFSGHDEVPNSYQCYRIYELCGNSTTNPKFDIIHFSWGLTTPWYDNELKYIPMWKWLAYEFWRVQQKISHALVLTFPNLYNPFELNKIKVYMLWKWTWFHILLGNPYFYHDEIFHSGTLNIFVGM